MTDYLDIISVWYRDVLMFKAMNDANHLIFREEIQYIKRVADRSSYEGLEKILDALEKAKAGDFDAAAKLMKQSKDVGIKAHHIQTQLLSTEAAGEHLSVDVLLVHAQDHLMCSMLAQELVQELICLYERTAAKNA